MKTLPITTEEIIYTFIKEKINNEELDTLFPNKLLREDVLELLEHFCKVVYYPLEQEDNNGFHINDMILAGKKENFVFINTAQTMEKQVFTAAHELGHIWNVDDYAVNIGLIEDTIEKREMLINRFAAVLLMPKDDYQKIFQEIYCRYVGENGKITLENLLHFIVEMMNYFFVPEKAIVCRLCELGYLSEELADALISDNDITNAVKAIIANSGYVKFQKPSMKKWIKGLPEILEKASENKVVSEAKIEKMRDIFNISNTQLPLDSSKEVELTKQDGCEN